MAALILRLRLSLLVGAFRGRRRAVVIRILGALVVLVGAASIALVMIRTAAAEPATACALAILISAMLVLCHAAIPALVGADDPLDPRRFRTLGRSTGETVAGLALATLVSVPTVLTLIALAAIAVIGVNAGASTALVVVGAVGTLAMCVFASRAVMIARSMMGAGSGGRPDTVAVIASAVLLAILVSIALTAPVWDDATRAALERTAGALAISPLGAWAAIGAAPATDGAVVGWGVWLVGIVSLIAVVGLWILGARHLLRTIEHPVVAREDAGLGWFTATPRSATGAIAARSLLYGFTDSRYVANVSVIPVAAIFAMVPLLVAGVPFAIAVLLPVPIMALLYGWLPHNDLAYDSSALWHHIASGVRGTADRLGRLAPVLAIAVPVLAMSVALTALLTDGGALVWAQVGVSVALLFTGLGLSSVSSVVWPYPVSRPGDNPFRQPQRTGSAGLWSQSLVMVFTVALSWPTLWLAWTAHTVDASTATLALWTGIGTGAIVFAIGVGAGSLIFDRRGSALMEFAGAT